MKTPSKVRSTDDLLAENALLTEEVYVARRASEITADLVVEQFMKMEEINQLLRQKATTERELQEQLKQELREAEARERELEEARRAADTANRTKSTFLANMSHELRTPLNAIIGYSELVQEELEDQGNSELTADLQKITTAGKHLLSLINDILDLSKIEAGKVEFRWEEFDLREAVEDIVATVKPLVQNNANTLVVRCSPTCGTMRSDLVRVRQCLFNLLSNACKFTEQGTIELEVSREIKSEVDWILLRVKDSGIGMTAEQLDKLFQPFMQADASSTRKYSGTGLGLSITKRFCELMGGSIAVQSQLGAGSTFTIRLPAVMENTQVRRAPPLAAILAEEEHDKAHTSFTVLAIDDDPASREWIQRSLSLSGVDVVTAANGPEGLRLARQVHPAVIILDVVMPEMDGWAVLSALKEDPQLADTPVIVATIVDEEDMGFALGVADYIMKPLERDRLLAAINRYCPHLVEQPILIVDDDPVVREGMRRVLQKEKWQVMEAENGRVALQRVAEKRPGLILLDLLMPEMDGFDFLTTLRQQQEWATIPVIVITAKDLTYEDHERLNRSVQRIIQKGAYNRTDLLREVRRLISDRIAASAAAP